MTGSSDGGPSSIRVWTFIDTVVSKFSYDSHSVNRYFAGNLSASPIPGEWLPVAYLSNRSVLIRFHKYYNNNSFRYIDEGYLDVLCFTFCFTSLSQQVDLILLHDRLFNVNMYTEVSGFHLRSL